MHYGVEQERSHTARASVSYTLVTTSLSVLFIAVGILHVSPESYSAEAILDVQNTMATGEQVNKHLHMVRRNISESVIGEWIHCY